MKKENKFKWEHNKSPETKAMAGTLAKYNYENLVDMHNETIDKLIEEFEKKIDLTFVSMNDYLDLILSDDFNKDDLLNCIHEYGMELKQKLNKQ